MTDVPPGFEVHTVSLEPGCDRIYHEREWLDAIVVVGRGEIEVECRGGTRQRLAAGDVLWFAGLPLRVIRNHGADEAVLVTFSRRTRAV